MEKLKKYLLILKNKTKEENGMSTTIMGFGKMLLIFSIFFMVFHTINITTLLTSSRELIEDATIETLQKNYANLYHTSRESYSGGYRPSEVGFLEKYILDKSSIINNLSKNEGLQIVDENISKLDKNNKILYEIKDIKMNVNNEPIRSGSQRFIITTRYIFEYPIVFFGSEHFIKVPIKIKVKHTGKY